MSSVTDFAVHDILPWLTTLVAVPLAWAWRLSTRLTLAEAQLEAQRDLASQHKAWTADVSGKVDRLGEALARIEGRLLAGDGGPGTSHRHP